MKMGKWPWFGIGLGIGAVIVPIVVRAPEPALNLPRDVRTLEEAVDDCMGTRLAGWELVDYATHLVNQKFTRYSLWHLWESSGQAFERSRGCSVQYNLALGRVLAALGFEVEVVRADQVEFDTERPGETPDWTHQHTWLRVNHDGQVRDVSAAGADHRAGQVRFHPLGEVVPQQPGEGVAWRLKLAPVVIYEVWKAWLTRRPVPRWIFRGFHDQG